MVPRAMSSGWRRMVERVTAWGQPFIDPEPLDPSQPSTPAEVELDGPLTDDVVGPQVVAGIDLGSNSFHMIVVRLEDDGRVHILDKVKEPVRLAAGLNEDRELDDEAQGRALEALERIAERLGELPATHVRAVGTNTLRQVRNGEDFLEQAEAALGHDIDIISGPEEARLIYLGVAHSSYYEGDRLVMDIGGGSTEFIIGRGFTPQLRDSMYMGCVSYSDRFFGKGKLTEKNFRDAEVAAKRELLSIQRRYKRFGWSRATGASGTLKAVDAVLRGGGLEQPGHHPRGPRSLEGRPPGAETNRQDSLRRPRDGPSTRLCRWRCDRPGPPSIASGSRSWMYPTGLSAKGSPTS